MAQPVASSLVVAYVEVEGLIEVEGRSRLTLWSGVMRWSRVDAMAEVLKSPQGEGFDPSRWCSTSTRLLTYGQAEEVVDP
ncbi:MAG: hypothetical protein LC808_10580 [Actinobacteria bacterium]|nr:hypothetical protein [Actinomycetota bacterium]